MPAGLDTRPTLASALVAAAALLGVACAATPDTGDAPLPNGADASTVGASCSASSPSLGQTDQPLSVVDRSLVGGPVEYATDDGLRARESSLYRSQRARREAAWGVAARVLRPVPLSGSLAGATLPAWQTWHNKDDLTRIFRRLYPVLSPAERAGRERFADAAVDEAWAWNDGAVADFEAWTLERLSAYRDAIDTAAQRAGVGGVYRVAYSPTASRHALQSYGDILDCRASDDLLDAPAPMAAAGVEGCAREPSFVPACLASQFPAPSVLVKATWQRLDAGVPFFAYDTSAESLAEKLAPDGPIAWGEGDRPSVPGEDEMYTLELSNGNRFGLTGLHIMTKELEHWIWVTLWWSDRPDEDFGADRPADFPVPFAHYKLCSVISFDEGDADPTGGFEPDHASLARALEVTHAGAGAATWCSNPYIERGDGNLSTNCIGCHQHAGTRLRSEEILADAVAFPDFARRQVESTFPSDYVFSVRTGDDLGAMFEETEDYYRPQ
jgi:hypothetical protein